MSLNVVLYNRISTKNQSLESQFEFVEKYCKKKENNYNIVGSFKEQISGASDIEDRKAMDELLTFCFKKENKVDAVVVYDISRLSRRLSTAFGIIEKLSEHKISVINASKGTSTLDENKELSDSNELVFSIEALFAQQERKKIQYNMQRGKDYKITHEGYSGYSTFIPYGYKSENKLLKIDEEESKYIKLIFKSYLLGLGSLLLADLLNGKRIDIQQTRLSRDDVKNLVAYSNELELKENSIISIGSYLYLENIVPTRYAKNGKYINYKKSGKIKSPTDFRFRDKTVIDILKNPIYHGKRIYKGEPIKTKSIISEDTFNRVQDEILERSKKFKKKTTYNYSLNNKLIKCGLCGNNFYVIRRSSGKDNRYLCFTKRGGKCASDGIGINKLTDAVYQVLSNKEEIIEEIKNSSDIKVLTEDLETYMNDLSNEKEIINRMNLNINDLNVLKVEQNLDVEEYKVSLDTFRIKKNDAKKEVEILEEKIENLKKVISTKQELPRLLSEFVKDKSGVDYLLNKFIHKIVLYPTMIQPLSTYKGDKSIYIELFIKGLEKPIDFLISQRSNNILYTKSAFNVANKCFSKEYQLINEDDTPVSNMVNIVDITKRKTIRKIKLAMTRYQVNNKEKLKECKILYMTSIIYRVNDGFNQ